MLTSDEKEFLTIWLMEIGMEMYWEGDMVTNYPATGMFYRSHDVWMDILCQKGYVRKRSTHEYTLTHKAIDELGEHDD